MAEKFASNIIRTKIWTGFSSFSNLCSLFFLFCLLIPVRQVSAQTKPATQNTDYLQNLRNRQLFSPYSYDISSPLSSVQSDTTQPAQQQSAEDFPEPKSVLYKSMIIPGWGQLVNKQAWKIPIVYGLIGGAIGYNLYLTQRYRDYRAAYYNRNHSDMKFGPTPDYIPSSVNADQLLNTRNRLRNRRDLSYLGIVLAYGLNVLDAYIFAHMRSFDVSENLSAKTELKPALMAESSPGITISVKLFNQSK
ncbi:DUF5683 domain-containing protein [Aliifodinibius sp. S!AR15-10]|uniref:DUF5683 domain-containing protein n=1 Tax=Aliifodinibius sp. S!AR15-10 TaxID=2950437 RepID=UPI00287097F8|nr:DUF5683 domain-containing protein [Aliifodinibius sp. S!AR15-10]